MASNKCFKAQTVKLESQGCLFISSLVKIASDSQSNPTFSTTGILREYVSESSSAPSHAVTIVTILQINVYGADSVMESVGTQNSFQTLSGHNSSNPFGGYNSFKPVGGHNSS